MLELKGIVKDYETASQNVRALKGIDIQFRENEFVSILGPSGCGKTTLLNIIGGLDRYTEGDLFINGVSTKEFKDKDWDTYRNHSIGFVFQNYNLIPHQTVLSNVELALTLSGVSKEERRKRAKEVLEKVGLGDQLNKKPNQMSGGQMQRVAIARALINNPDILLADEPTGALDTKTSVQIMEILKEISKDRLIIMVTHNPELAEKYSSRIIKLLDGNVVDDSNPYKENVKSKEKKEKKGKPSMSFFTALNLSLNNLMTKKGRTFLTAFAGSIGIIGIALIMSLSNGIQNYISKVEEDTLSSYPIMLEETTMDMTDMMNSVMGVAEGETVNQEEGKIYSRPLISDLLSMMSKQATHNNLEEFKKYLEDETTNISQYANAIQYSYNLDLNLYNMSTESGEYLQVAPNQILNELGYEDMAQMSQSSFMSSSMASNEVWVEMLDNKELLHSQYDVVSGRWPEAFNEVVVIVDENNQITDYTLYSLGLLDPAELAEKYEALFKGEEVAEVEQKSYSYEELLNLNFKVVLNTDYYEKQGNMWIDRSSDKEFMEELLANSTDIKVVGIVRPNEETVSTSMAGGIGYTSDLKYHVIDKVRNSEIAKEQLENEEINVFTGLEFTDKQEFDYSNLSDEQKAYMQTLTEEELANLMANYSANNEATYESNLKKLGIVDVEKPSRISIYPIDFDSKEAITNLIEEYNKKQTDEGKEENVISYSDLIGTMMNSVTSIINVISYVLIAFVGVSLVVSSIMIGIITYISVLERTKEIGILRSIGASKKDISRVFNAETLSIGLIAGLLGIGVTALLCIPINVVIKSLVNVSNIAVLPINGAIILVIISVVLTVIAGLIPAKVAAKKDPVEALRTE